MKRTITFLFALLFATSLVFSQAVGEGSKIINLDIGFVTLFNNGKIEVPPLSVSFEYLIKQVGPGTIGVGGMAGYATSKEELKHLPGKYYQHTFVLLGARGTYHWFPGQNDKIDTYAGIIIGYKIASSKYLGEGTVTDISQKSAMLGSMLVGIRYFPIPKFGFNAELSYGIAVFNLGFTLKFDSPKEIE